MIVSRRTQSAFPCLLLLLIQSLIGSAEALLFDRNKEKSKERNPVEERSAVIQQVEQLIPTPEVIYRQQSEALQDFYQSTLMFSPYSRRFHNWTFSPPGFVSVTLPSDIDLNHSASVIGESMLNFYPSPSYCSFSGVTCDTFGYVIVLDLNFSGLSGELPTSLGQLVRLQRLQVYNNSIQGNIQKSLLVSSPLRDLRQLNLGRNYFTGPLPDDYFRSGGSPFLQRLILENNRFTGTLPSSLCSLSQLLVLELSGISNLTGTIPDCFGSSLSVLQRFRVTDSSLTGVVPPGLCGGYRAMNGLDPNPFGCDGIACPAGTFSSQSRHGRQTSSDDPCEQCAAPSNIVGASTCRFLPPPKLSSFPSAGPSADVPRTTLPPASIAPAPHTALPTTLRPTFPVPSVPPSVNEFVEANGIGESTHPKDDKDLSRKIVGLISLSPVFSILVVLLVYVLIKKRQKPRFIRVDEDSSETLQSDDVPFSDQCTDNLPRPPQVDVLPMPHTLSEFSDMTLATRVSHVSILRSTSLTPSVPPSSLLSSGRRVRFSLPTGGSLPSTSSVDSEEREDNSVTKPASFLNDREAWLSWVVNPLFQSCSPVSLKPRFDFKNLKPTSFSLVNRDLEPNPNQLPTHSPVTIGRSEKGGSLVDLSQHKGEFGRYVRCVASGSHPPPAPQTPSLLGIRKIRESDVSGEKQAPGPVSGVPLSQYDLEENEISFDDDTDFCGRISPITMASLPAITNAAEPDNGTDLGINEQMALSLEVLSDVAIMLEREYESDLELDYVDMEEI
jgi:hypothetical protein